MTTQSKDSGKRSSTSAQPAKAGSMSHKNKSKKSGSSSASITSIGNNKSKPSY